MRINKRNFALIGFVATAVFTANIAHSGKFKFDDRWNTRFITDSPKGSDAKNDTVNYNTGKKIKEDGTSESAPAPSADVQAFGKGSMHCRDTVVKVRTSDDGSAALSSVTIAEVKNTASTSVACTSFAPRLYTAGLAVDKGTVSLKCNNGQLRVVAADCAGTPPTPTAPGDTPVAGGGAGGGDGGGSTPAPPANGCPAGNSVKTACGCCSDAVTTYNRTRSGGGKEGMQCQKTNTQFRSCTNGQYFWINSGQCRATKPIAC